MTCLVRTRWSRPRASRARAGSKRPETLQEAEARARMAAAQLAEVERQSACIHQEHLNKAYTPQMTNGSTMNARGLLGRPEANRVYKSM
jgi:hypothetical protein